jgi:predicted RNA binding protein YcfA (HicA-like mRNA interferase family)
LSIRLPRVNAGEVIRVLEKIGFALTRQSGSHKIYKNSEGRRVTVSFHGSTILKPKTLKSILNEANLTIQDFVDLLSS